VGKRVDLIEPRRAEAMMSAVYVCGARPLDFGVYVLTEGVEVPGAADWPRIEAWVNARRVRQLRADEEYTAFEDFKALWELEHPEPEPEPEQTEATEDSSSEE
jgi:hypothetical protein